MSVAIKAARAGSQGGIRRGTNVQQGGIFSAIGGALKKVAGAGLAIATGGGIAGAARAIGIGGASAAVVRTLPAIGPTLVGGGGGGQLPVPVPRGVPVPGARGAIQRALPFGETGYGGGCPSGFHPNKSGYMTRDGYVEKGTRCVRNRKRNPLNPRALDRSMGRLRSAGKAIRALGFRAPSVKDVATGKARKRKR